ncbi:MAG: hypothetical protein E7663_06760 [Ruminococcaceae bacterium]|nr:hypothetical protein [Oscillospiraceae bacterium]
MPVKVGLRYIEVWKDCLETAVREYEKEEQKQRQIVFYGPSYFTRWSKAYGMKPMAEVLRGKSGASCVINRGFGSSCAEHQLYYYDRMIRPLAPSVLVYHFHGNGSSFGYSAQESFEIAQRVIAYARTDFPDIRIYLVGVHPTKKDFNWSEQADAERIDRAMRNFAAETPNCHFVDVLHYEPLMRKDIFVEDGVHFDQAGYDIYADLYREVLKEELARF